jgi:hypothetical protein
VSHFVIATRALPISCTHCSYSSLRLSVDGIGPVGVGETPETLWGADKVDPKEAFEANGFQMRRVVLTRPPDGRGRRGNGGAKKEVEKTE